MTIGRRVILIVLDGVGVGALPDAAQYGDQQAATLQHVATACGGLRLPNLQALGLGCLGCIEGVPPARKPSGGYGRMKECSVGKDSTTGHWEMAGVILDQPFATYPQGFPSELVEEFATLIGSVPLGNVSASGISILKEYGGLHMQTGRPILYTSVDSVFQIAAHEEIIPTEKLYDICRQARRLVDRYRIGRVIARPFTGNLKEGFRRTPRRKDFSMPPPQPTLLDHLVAGGYPVATVGKICDLFAAQGITSNVSSENNRDGMVKVLEQLALLNKGLLMVNLIDFDMVFGHRQDARGFGAALEEFDAWLPQLTSTMTGKDLLIITADHGCDPTTPGTDHTREFVPVLCWSPAMPKGVDLGDRASFADLGATVADYFGLGQHMTAQSFFSSLGV